jgi:hypothetical protein
MNYYDDFDRLEELDELKRRVERKRENAAAKRLAKSKDFSLYLEESGPLNLEQELGYSIDTRNWDD